MQVKQNSEDETFADRLATAMLAKGLGLGKLSQQTGITQRQLVNYRKGRHEPRDYYGQPTSNAALLASALDVDVEWLVPPGPSRASAFAADDDPDLEPAA